MESQTSTISQQNEGLITKQKLLQTKMQEHSNHLVSKYHRLHGEIQERVKDGFSGLSLATKEVHEQLRGVESLQEEMTDKQKEMLDQQKDMSDHKHSLANSLSKEFATLHDKTHEIAHSMSEEFSSLHKKSHVIADSLVSLQEILHIMANSLAKEFSSLHEKSHGIAQSLTTEFSRLHGIMHEIDNGVQRSLTGQKALLDEQVQAKEGLHNLKQLQESAFEENRASVLAFTQEAKMHQQEFLMWQTKLCGNAWTIDKWFQCNA